MFHETQLLTLKFHRANEVKTCRVSLRIVTGNETFVTQSGPSLFNNSDAVLILKQKKNKTFCLIQPPMRTDLVTPVAQEREISLILMNDHDCPTGKK